MRILGLGAIMLILPVAVWGWRMLTHRTFDREALRIACWILCTVIAAGFASCWPHGGAGPLPARVGGAVLSCAVVGTSLIACGLGSRPQEDELTEIEDDDAQFVEGEDDRGSVSLGWAFHAVMSARARLWRLLT